MKKFIIISVLLIINNISFSQTHIPGGDVSGTWTIEGSPYIIDGHINVPIDSTLIIEPGVNIFFPEQNHFRVYGRLIAEGTESDTISFTASDTTDTFAGLYFCETDTSFQDSSKMSFCKFDPGCVSFNNSSCAVLINSIVTNGYGIGFDNSSPTIVDVIISNNTTDYYGGGITCTNSSNPSLVNVTIRGNTAAGAGGIWCNDNSNPTLDNVYIENNSPNGFSCTSSSPILNNVTISGHEGGGFSCSNNSNPILNNVIISNNSVYGGIGCANSSPTLNNVVISENYAIYGGGIYCEDESNLILNNVTITGNEAGYLGGGIYSDFSNIIVVNSLIIGNSAGGGGGGIGCFYGSNMSLTNVTISENISGDGFGGGIYTEFECNIHLENCIMWNDIPNEAIIMTGSFVSANYCDIEGGAMGTGNIDDDPLFIDSENGDFHLSEGSPCIDAGNPDSLYYDIEDPYSPGYALYPAMGTILNDMGAYGGHGYYGPPVAVDDELILNQNLIQLRNYPNPFNPSTTIFFNVSRKDAKDVKTCPLWWIEIYNIKGQIIRTIDTFPSWCLGTSSVFWDGQDKHQNQVSSGIYLYRIRTDDFISEAKKMILIR